MKDIIGWIIGAVVAILSALLGVERSRRKKAQEKQEEAELEAKIQEVKNEVDRFADSVRQELTGEVISIKEEEVKQVEEVLKSEDQTQTYNDLIKGFNSRGQK